MVETDHTNNNDNGAAKEAAFAASEASRISTILENQVRRAECGCIVQIPKELILEPESNERIRCDWIYGIISNEEDVCEDTGSVAYQVNWCTAHLPTGNSFLSLVAPVWEHDFSVLKFPECEMDEEDVELRRQFKKHNGEWLIVEYGGYSCEYCEEHSCDRAQYRDELEVMFEEVSQMGVPPNQKRYMMYRQFIALKHGPLGNRVRRKLDDCVQELVVCHFPVEAGKRKWGFVDTVNHN